jgi:hypothetical protein
LENRHLIRLPERCFHDRSNLAEIGRRLGPNDQHVSGGEEQVEELGGVAPDTGRLA